MIQKQRDVAELLEQEVQRIRTEMFTSECKVGDMERVLNHLLRQWEIAHGESLLEQEAEQYAALSESLDTGGGEQGERMNEVKGKLEQLKAKG